MKLNHRTIVSVIDEEREAVVRYLRKVSTEYSSDHDAWVGQAIAGLALNIQQGAHITEASFAKSS